MHLFVYQIKKLWEWETAQKNNITHAVAAMNMSDLLAFPMQSNAREKITVDAMITPSLTDRFFTRHRSKIKAVGSNEVRTAHMALAIKVNTSSS